MSDNRKISIVVLGTEDYLKKNLISLTLGRDVFAHRSSDVKIETYENDTYEVTFTPHLYDAHKDIRRLFSSQRDPDMCLLVVEDGFSTQEVLQHLEKLHKITRKSTEEFRVVLPLQCKPEEAYPFNFYTMEELFTELRKMANKTNQGPADQRNIQMDTEEPSFITKTGKHQKLRCKKKLKGNHSVNKVNLVLLGMSGTGKSSTGNSILGWQQFESKASSMPVTTECQAAETVINGTRVRVVDTPDIFDDEIKLPVKNQHVTQCKQLCQSDPCVYLLVIHVSRFTDGEKKILRKFEEAFGPKAKKQTIILFTRGDDLQSSDMSLKDFLHSCQPELKNIVKQCDRRCVVFENKTSRQHQVKKLMETVNMMLNK